MHGRQNGRFSKPLIFARGPTVWAIFGRTLGVGISILAGDSPLPAEKIIGIVGAATTKPPVL